MTDDGAPASCTREERKGEQRRSTLNDTAAVAAHRRRAGGDFVADPSVQASADGVRR
jgi:hypothetical protein